MDRLDYRKSLGLPKRHETTYDSRCHDLAAIFLGDEPALHTPENIHQLAQLIQGAIEDYIEFNRPAPDQGQFGVGARVWRHGATRATFRTAARTRRCTMTSWT